MKFGVVTDYDYAATHKRDRLHVWSGPFFSVYEATGMERPNHKGYTLTTFAGEKIRVDCPSPRREDNYTLVDAAIGAAMLRYYESGGCGKLDCGQP